MASAVPTPANVAVASPDSAGDAGGHRHAVDQAVQRQPNGRAAPGKRRARRDVAMIVCVPWRSMVMRVLTGRRGAWPGDFIPHVVMVEVEKSLEKEHEQKTGQYPDNRAIDRTQDDQAVRQQVQQPDAEHHAGNEADRDLHPPMREPHHQRDPAARERPHDAHRTIHRQQQTRLHDAFSERAQYPRGAG